jgi:hypothetical protein
VSRSPFFYVRFSLMHLPNSGLLSPRVGCRRTGVALHSGLWPHTPCILASSLRLATLGREYLLNELGWGVLAAFTTGFLFIYALAARVLVRHQTFWLTSQHFEAAAHYFLITLFAFAFAHSGLPRPLFYAPFVLAAVGALGVRITAAIRSRKMAVLRATAR